MAVHATGPRKRALSLSEVSNRRMPLETETVDVAQYDSNDLSLQDRR